MDEKTAELRDVFLEVAGEEEVTERQSGGRGSLAGGADVEERLAREVGEMREAVGFETDLADDELVTVVRRFYADDSDAEIAVALEGTADEDRSAATVDPETVAAARLDLHLLRDADVDAPFDLDAFREAVDAGADDDKLAERFDADRETVRWQRRVLATRREIQRTNDRYRGAFADALRDLDLSERLTASGEDDGLEEATEGQEIDLPL